MPTTSVRSTSGRRPASRRKAKSGTRHASPSTARELIPLAGQLAGRGRFAALASLAPTVLGIVGRYARRKPVKAAGLTVVAGGLFLLGRAVFNAATSTSDLRAASAA
jgi:hypothetical protein